ncbi:hypothetical protein DPM19_17225 [Actinomadura craniellae]|uniref:Serine/threonine protein kinase n=1 Tax=Actinomadura craniellae TaxID=2231787 RepID=A0A365H4I7_9ACTN|nr:hypothetical protein [Actinomadura craniellae]RAY14024.1 hypothetical protein DPM19_17225 [Actinomadura craniellae]
MSRPLPPGDPLQLGPFRLSARLAETPAGIVYLGVDEAGRRVSVAVLTRGAAQDAAARDRFRAAVSGALPGVERPVPGGPAPVVAAQPLGPAPWVATVFEPDRVGAERFLEAVLPPGMGREVVRGPGFQPYWLGSREPAVGVVAPVPVVAPVARPERGLVAAVVTLVAMLGVLLLLLLLLFACQPEVSAPVPVPSEFPSETYQPPSAPPPAPSPSPLPSSPSPSPSGSPSPSPSGSPGGPSGPDDGPL